MDFQSQIMDYPAGTQESLGNSQADAQVIDEIAWRKMGASLGDAESMYKLGQHEADSNPNQAVSWYHKAAALDHVGAMHELGMHYEDGKGVTKDEQKALEWYEKAAAKNHADSMYNIGVMYMEGVGRMDSEEEAIYWFKKGAALNDSDCMFHLGLMEKDNEKATEWLKKAVELGNPEAKAMLVERAAKQAAATSSAYGFGSALKLAIASAPAPSPVMAPACHCKELEKTMLTAFQRLTDVVEKQGEELKTLLQGVESTPAPKRKAMSVPPAPIADRKRRALLDEMEDVATFRPVPLPSADEEFFGDGPSKTTTSKAKASNAPKVQPAIPHFPSGTLFRYRPAKVPRGSVSDHYTAVALKDGAVLQVKSLMGIRGTYPSLMDWIATIPDATYEDLEIEEK